MRLRTERKDTGGDVSLEERPTILKKIAAGAEQAKDINRLI